MSPSTVSKLIRIYELFVMKFGYTAKHLAKAGGWSVVAEILPVVKEDTPKEKIEELLESAAIQPRSDFRRTVSDFKRGAPCKHKHTRKLVLEICEDCGDRWKVGEEDERPSTKNH